MSKLMSSLRESFLLRPAVTRILGRELGVGVGGGNSDPEEDRRDICLDKAATRAFCRSDDLCLTKPVLCSIILDHIKISFMQSSDLKCSSDRTR